MDRTIIYHIVIVVASIAVKRAWCSCAIDNVRHISNNVYIVKTMCLK